jgi:ADP-ribose pyrophosphatase YjhB (NUDIX family)
MFAARTDAPLERIEALFAGETGSATPKVDVRAAVFDDDDRVLMVREASDGGRWTLPGGWADVNRTAAQNVVKEALEESGFDVEPLKARGSLGPHETGARPARLLLLQILLRLRANRWPGGDQPRDLGGRLVSRGEHPCRTVVRTRPAATDPTHVCPPSRPVPADRFRLNSGTTNPRQTLVAADFGGDRRSEGLRGIRSAA